MVAWRIQKVADEGMSSPYYARIWSGIAELRDSVLSAIVDSRILEAERYKFDEKWDPVLRDLDSARNIARNIPALITAHRVSVETGRIIRFQRNAFEISESIGEPLRSDFGHFLTVCARAAKDTQNVVKYFGPDIGFLFASERKFSAGVTKLESYGHKALTQFLRMTRKTWSEELRERRRVLEHTGWRLPDINYKKVGDSKISMIEPELDGTPVSRYVLETFNRLASFVENMVVYSFQCALKTMGVGIAEIPVGERPTDYPKRFMLWHPIMNKSEWVLSYSEDNFL